MDDWTIEIPRRVTEQAYQLIRQKYRFDIVMDWLVRFGPRTVAEVVAHVGGERRDALALDLLDLIRMQGEDRRSIPLGGAEWMALDRIAAETGSLAERGEHTGRPSWRTLLRRIATGELRVIAKEKEIVDGALGD